MNIPNLITIFRLLAVPAIIYVLLHEQMVAAFLLFVIAGLSDAIDGAIARLFNQRTELGAWLDPLADKLLMVSAFVMLGWLGKIPDWIVFLVVTRDALIVGAVIISHFIGNPLPVSPLFISKTNTVVQIMLIVIVLANNAFQAQMWPAATFMLYLTALLTFASGASYLIVWMRHIAGTKQDGNG